MPTPRPSIVARVGATTGMSTRWPSSPISPRPVTSPTMAVRIGMPAATSVPKVIARITMPAARPIISLRRECSSESRMPSTPPASTWMPASLAGCAAAMTSLARSRVTAPPFTSMSTWATAVFSSSLTSSARAPRANGLVTLVTCGAASMRRTDSLMARSAAGSSTVPAGGVEDDGALAVLLGREVPREEVGGRLRLGPRQADVVGGAGAEHEPARADHGDDARPRQQHDPRAPHAPVAESVEEGGHAREYPSCGRDPDDTYPGPSVKRSTRRRPAEGPAREAT